MWNSEERRSRSSSKCSMPMHERRCSPVSALSSRRRPSLSWRHTSRARINCVRSASFKLSSFNAKVQRPRRIHASSAASFCKAGRTTPKDSGAGTNAMSPGPASLASFNSPFRLCTKTRSGVKVSRPPPVTPTSSRLSFGRSVPPNTRTSRRRPSAARRSPKAQHRHGVSAERFSQRAGSTARACASPSPPPSGMKVFTVSCNASIPSPVFALPATSGAMVPAATARLRAASIIGRGTLPSSSK
mmetsp:Transcript_104976/g.306672  ORF Transcript_104976/g.306672 Transcript_104976/m.306672 type:complete len:244 (+) Transcript_104976:1031-1762(+)